MMRTTVAALLLALLAVSSVTCDASPSSRSGRTLHGAVVGGFSLGQDKGMTKDKDMQSATGNQTACVGAYCTDKGGQDYEGLDLKQKTATGAHIVGSEGQTNALIASVDLGPGISNTGTGITLGYNGAQGDGDGAKVSSIVTNDVNTTKTQTKPKKVSKAITDVMGQGSDFNIGVTTNTNNLDNITLVLSTGGGFQKDSVAKDTATATIDPAMMLTKSENKVETQRNNAVAFGLAATRNIEMTATAGFSGNLKGLGSGKGKYTTDSSAEVRGGDKKTRTSKTKSRVESGGFQSLQFGGTLGASGTFKDFSFNKPTVAASGAILLNAFGRGNSESEAKAVNKDTGDPQETEAKSSAGTALVTAAGGGSYAAAEKVNSYSASGSLLLGYTNAESTGTKRKKSIFNFLKNGDAKAKSVLAGVGGSVAGSMGGKDTAMARTYGAGAGFAMAGYLRIVGGVLTTVIPPIAGVPIPNFAKAKFNKGTCRSSPAMFIPCFKPFGRRLLVA